jgi:spore coat polysaccharide biosynthesis protein SpsF
MEALGRIPCDIHILACPDDSVTAFEPLAKEAGFALIPGPKHDVLRRFCIALRRYSVDWVIRATGDNPFVFADAAIALQEEAVAIQADYAGYSGLPYGAGVEVIKAQALFCAEEKALADPEREHVCPYLYNHPEQFRLHRPLAPLPWQGPQIRISVDTQADYERALCLYQALAPLSADNRVRGETIISVFRKTFSGYAKALSEKECP